MLFVVLSISPVPYVLPAATSYFQSVVLRLVLAAPVKSSLHVSVNPAGGAGTPVGAVAAAGGRSWSWLADSRCGRHLNSPRLRARTAREGVSQDLPWFLQPGRRRASRPASARAPRRRGQRRKQDRLSERTC